MGNSQPCMVVLVHHSDPEVPSTVGRKTTAKLNTRDSRLGQHRVCMQCITKGGTKHSRGLLLLSLKPWGLIDCSHIAKTI